MKISVRQITLILFLIVTVVTITFTREITEATGRIYIIGKDNGVTRRLELILICSTLCFILFSKKRWWWRPFLGFVVGIASAILGYVTALIVWPDWLDGLILFHILSSMFFMCALYVLNKRTNHKLLSEQ